HNIGFHLPSEAAQLAPKATLNATQPYSWADADRGISAWLGNPLQNAANKKLYSLLPAARKAHKLDTWRKLSTSDHYYYMCTKYAADGDVHKYFNPHDSPYDGFIAFMNVLKDFSEVIA
ncbi:MAG: alpha-amylase, partial [Nanoarchaeota archaeon]